MSKKHISQEKIIQFNNLPKISQQFVTKYFNTKNISSVWLDDDFFSKDYEVHLNDGTKIEFDGKGNWKEIDTKQQQIPTLLIPKEINKYVTKAFPQTQIIKIEKKRFGYKIELNNDLDLVFNTNGDFLRIDD